MWPPPHQPTPDPHRRHLHHHHPSYDLHPSYPPQFHPTIAPPPPPPNYPNFNPNLHLLPPPPDFRLPPSPSIPPLRNHPVSNFGSPNCIPPIHDPVIFRVSWPDHHPSLNPNDLRFSSFNRDSARQEAGDYARQRFASGMDVDHRHRHFRYDSVGGQRSPGYGGFDHRSTSPMDIQGDVVHRGLCNKRQRYVSGAGPGEYMRAHEGFVAHRSEGNVDDLHGKVQRKSALLRIGGGSSPHSSYGNKKCKYSGNGSSSKTSPFKVKYSSPSPAKHRIKKEGENALRENTAVHVSFKSNSVVAKQIVTPSSPVDITNNSVTPRSRKFSKLAVTGVNDLVVSSHDVNLSPMKLQESGNSLQSLSHPDKTKELTKGSDDNAVNRNLFDICPNSVGQADRYDDFFSVDNCISSGGKRRKKRKLLENRVPLSMQPIDEQSVGTRSFSHETNISCKDSKVSCHMLPTTSIETGSLIISLDVQSQPLLPQHIGEEPTESSIKHCGYKQSDFLERQVHSDCSCEKTVTDIAAAKGEIESSKHFQDKCIQTSHLDAIIDQSCSDDIVEKDILEEQTVTLTRKGIVDVGFSPTNSKKRKEIKTHIDDSESIPAVTVHENDLFNQVKIDSDKGGCASPVPVGLEKEVTCVMDEDLVPLVVSYSSCDVTTTISNEAESRGVCDDQSSSVPVSSSSLALHKYDLNISDLAQVRAESSSSTVVAVSSMKTCSDTNVRSTMVSLEKMQEGNATVVNSRLEQISTDAALGNDKKEMDNKIGITNLGRKMQVDSLSSLSRGAYNPKYGLATSGSLNYQRSHALKAPFRASSSVYFASPKVESSKMHLIKPRTWLRSDNDSTAPAPLSGKSPGSNSIPPHIHTLKSGKPSGSSYTRKGHSLVRNHSPAITVSGNSQVSTYFAPQPTFPGVENKKGFSEKIYDLTLGPNKLGSSEDLLSIQNYVADQPFEKTLPCVSDTCFSTPTRSPDGTGLDQIRDEMKLEETSKTQRMPINSFGEHAAVNEGSCISTKADYSLLSKHDSCQLSSASTPSHLTVEKAQNNQTMSYDSYYKTRMNQIIRTPLNSNQPLTVSGCNLKKEGTPAQNMVNKTSTLQSHKGSMHKSSNSSLVWTLRGEQPTCKITEDHFQSKRPTSWRDVRDSRASLNSRASLTLRKLTLYRNQNTLYKRSTNGLSLRKYKVVAMGGRNLKWFKSIEKRSKKASEDATRAVVATDSLKRVQSRPQNAMFREETKHRTSSKSARCVTPRPRGRIFRIGSLRYRMDPSRKTLRRVIDDGSARGDLEDAGPKIAYVPTRLAIGKNEYIRIGNGNQLVRDPKKRIRMLANEKIRWSLHNVRQRSMKKRRFCQFYTRFGKCNKDDGKCPYIHDSSKIAVCTKFLKGICSDLNCKLTHKVIPERMEDCSYFLQGMCSNENCPYRHVNVNPKAATCEGFLRGYCADGDECRKKHSYICHVYEETGSCPEGSKCKLHHPKKQKAKLTGYRLQNCYKGRYFGNPAPEVSDPQTVVPLKLSSARSSGIFDDGDIPDFISLDDDGTGDFNVTEDVSCSSKQNDNDMGIEVFDLNTLIKPIRIMYKLTAR